MIKNKKVFSLRSFRIIIGIFLVISIFVFMGLGFSAQYQDLKETYTLAKETTSFIKTECKKFDNYTSGNSARSVQDLLDKANGLNTFISDSKLIDSNFLKDFVFSEHVGGIFILDQNLSPVAYANMDDVDPVSIWSETLSKNKIKDVFLHPQKSYVDHVTIKNQTYDMAVVASDSGNRLILCYSPTKKPDTDPYELTVSSILENNSFYKNPTLVITDGTQVLSTNSSVVKKLGTKQYKKLVSSIEWKNDQLTKFKYKEDTYYGLRKVYNNYYCYTVYAANDVFSHRTALLTYGFMAYLAIIIIILAIQRHYDKLSINKMEKQLRIINAVSTAYNSTLLLHIKEMKLEPIKPSERLSSIYEKHRDPYNFLFTICKTEIDESFYSTVMHFLDLDTIAERVKGKPFLGCEVKDCYGVWFSVMLIPQKMDEEGNVQALLVTTRDITGIKQTEELTFKDQLTGLYNRNYMESRSKNIVHDTDLPVSLIMADCNYLKRTNDTLGHEYGDLLLQRVANIIIETIPQNAVAMRIGGDEFLILCTQCNNQQAQKIVEDIKHKLIKKSDDKLTLSVALGISTTIDSEFSFEKAYKVADEEMYRDKKASRTKNNSN